MLKGLWALFVGLAALGIGGLLGSLGGTEAAAVTGVFGILFFVLATAFWGVAVGLFMNKPWMWTATIAVYGIDLLWSLKGVLIDGDMGAVAIFILLVNVVIVVYAVRTLGSATGTRQQPRGQAPRQGGQPAQGQPRGRGRGGGQAGQRPQRLQPQDDRR